MPLNLTAPGKIHRLFLNKCPLHHVTVIGHDQYFWNDLKNTHPLSLSANKSASQKISDINLIKLKKFSLNRTFILLSGGDKTHIDDKILMEKKELILSLTADCVGLAFFELIKVIKKMEAKKLDSFDQLMTAVNNLTFDTDDVGIIIKPQKLQQLKNKFLNQKIFYQHSEKIKTKNFIENIFPVFTPHVFDEEMIVYNKFDSLVIGDSINYFLTEANQLAVELKIDIQNDSSLNFFKI